MHNQGKRYWEEGEIVTHIRKIMYGVRSEKWNGKET